MSIFASKPTASFCSWWNETDPKWPQLPDYQAAVLSSFGRPDLRQVQRARMQSQLRQLVLKY
jgi:hypothetical protein